MASTKVLIAIQARSTSSRLPRKVFQKIGNKTMLEHVVDACRGSAKYINMHSYSKKIEADVAVLVPEGDEIAYSLGSRISVLEGSEKDVLSRYNKALLTFNPDYIVRITADCPLIPHFLISKTINCGVLNKHDYCSNVDENFRTAVDGFDCEIMSRRALEWLNETATLPQDREHVTTLIRRSPPEWASMGNIIGYIDFSNVKLSVDTQEDLDRVKAMHSKISKAIELAEKKNGKSAVYRF